MPPTFVDFEKEREIAKNNIHVAVSNLLKNRGERKYFIGVDLGQASDYTALSVIEKSGNMAYIRHLERLQLGTPYPYQVSRIKMIWSTLPKGTRLIVDHTGVGRAVVDLIKREGMNPVALTITAGNEPTKEGMNWHIPKRDLISSLIVAFQTGNVKIAKSLPEAETLTRELMNFKLKVNLQTGHDSYEAWREGIHDDLVLSVAMAVYTAELGKPKATFLIRGCTRRW